MRPFRHFIGLAFTAGFIMLFVLRTDTGDITKSFATVRYEYLSAAIGVYFIVLWFRALRWHQLLYGKNSPGPNRLVPALSIGFMGNNLLPMRLGMVLRVHVLWSKFRIARGTIAGTLALEALFDGMVLAILFAPLLAGLGVKTEYVIAVLATGVGAFIGLVICLGGVWWRNSGKMPQRLASRVPLSIRCRAGDTVNNLAEGFDGIHCPRRVLSIMFVTAVGWVLTAMMYLLIGEAFALNVNWTAYLVLTAVLNLAIAIPSSQGGIGPYEFFATEVMYAFGAGKTSAAAFAVGAHIVVLMPISIVGLVFLALYHAPAIRAWMARFAPAPQPAPLRYD